MGSSLYTGLNFDILPPARMRTESVAHAPKRQISHLSINERKLCIKNALRYFPEKFHKTLASEFYDELETYGHIYMYRFLPDIEMKARSLNDYEFVCKEAGAIMLMIMNNLDPDVAQFPEELVTYGGNGQVFSNWIQFRLVMHYLSVMTDEQTLVMYSGHPMGLFPSSTNAPRVVITNGMVIANYSSRANYDKMFAMGVTQYGQMTAGSYCYIGPQGIVHGTTITLLNAARMYLKTDDLRGKVFVTAGLGGMSGAQAKAAIILGCVGVIAEVSKEALLKRYKQGWLGDICSNLDECMAKISDAKRNRKPLSLGYHGNVVDLWERLLRHYETTKELLVDLGSDQTSCHNIEGGGYCPVGLSYEACKDMLANDPPKFRIKIGESLLRHISAVIKLSHAGMHFWDYGNAFLLECSRAGAAVRDVNDTSGLKFIYPSYMQNIMGNIFSMGFGPYRWICCSNLVEDLDETDKIAAEILKKLSKDCEMPEVKEQYEDNLHWIENAKSYDLVVGSQARILYCDQNARCALASAFNEAIAQGRLKGPLVLSRDHHDVSGTDSPFRETSNIEDGSAFTADMAVQNFVGDAFRGATWISLHNGGGVGWGEVMNGGFGLVLDGSEKAAENAESMLSWDVWNGVSRRCWSGNRLAYDAIKRSMDDQKGRLIVTLPNQASDDVLDFIK